jgi:hypothetical protein
MEELEGYAHRIFLPSPPSLTTMVIIASFETFRLSLWASTASIRFKFETTSPERRMKSDLMSCERRERTWAWNIEAGSTEAWWKRSDLSVVKLSESVSYWECRGGDDSGDGEGGVRAGEAGGSGGRKPEKCTSALWLW